MVNENGQFYILGVVNEIGNINLPKAIKSTSTLTIRWWCRVNRCRLKIADTAGDPVDQSDGNFTIQSSHFKFTANTGESYNIVVAATAIDNPPLLPSDEIGVFTPAGLCVGAATETGTTPLPLSAWADDNQTPTIDGCKISEIMSFRIWSLSAITVSTAVATCSVGNGKFGDGAYARISRLEAQTTSQITISIPDTTRTIGSSIDIPVMITDVSGQGIISVALTIQTDTAILIPKSASNASTLTAGWNTPTYDTSNGQLTIALSGTIPLSGKGKLCFISYQVNPGVAPGRRTMVHSVTAMQNESDSGAIARDGRFRGSSGFRVAVKITYCATNLAVNDADSEILGAAPPSISRHAGFDSFQNICAQQLSLQHIQLVVRIRQSPLYGGAVLQSELETGHKAFKEALASSQQIEYLEGECRAMGNIGNVFDEIGQHDSALVYIHRIPWPCR